MVWIHRTWKTRQLCGCLWGRWFQRCSLLCYSRSSWVWVAFLSSALCNLQAPPSWGSLPWLPYCLKVKNATCQAPASTWIVTPRPILVSFGDLGPWRSSSGHKMSWAPPGLESGWVWVCVCVCVCVRARACARCSQILLLWVPLTCSSPMWRWLWAVVERDD